MPFIWESQVRWTWLAQFPLQCCIVSYQILGFLETGIKYQNYLLSHFCGWTSWYIQNVIREVMEVAEPKMEWGPNKRKTIRTRLSFFTFTREIMTSCNCYINSCQILDWDGNAGLVWLSDQNETETRVSTTHSLRTCGYTVLIPKQVSPGDLSSKLIILLFIVTSPVRFKIFPNKVSNGTLLLSYLNRS